MVPRLLLICAFLSSFIPSACAFVHHQDTGFLNRRIVTNGAEHKYMVYLPEGWNPHELWPIILFLHGSGERGSEGMDQTQIGLPQAIRLHPDRWPFIVVMPQVPFNHHHWTDPDMMTMAMAALEAETKEFHGDRDRTYITGLSLGGYGTWEIAKAYPHRFAAVVPVCGGVFWSYQPERWKDLSLPNVYARALGRTPVWIFHGFDDPVVAPKQSLLMYLALKAAGGNVRLWQYEKIKHNVWDKAYAVPDLPHWLLSHRLSSTPKLIPAAEQVFVPIHPVPAKVNPEIYDVYAGEYEDQGVVAETVLRQGDKLMIRNRIGEVSELLPENATTFFYPSGSASRLIFEKEPDGDIKGIRFRDDRHEEFWERKH